MMTKRVPMSYDKELGRWVAEGKDELYGLHCGEVIQLHHGRRTLNGRNLVGHDTSLWMASHWILWKGVDTLSA